MYPSLCTKVSKWTVINASKFRYTGSRNPLAHHIGTELYAEQVLGKNVAVPRTRGEVALLAWQLAGQPEPAEANDLLTDEAKARQWAVESGLLKLDAEGNFNAEKKLSKWKALRVLDKAQKLG